MAPWSDKSGILAPQFLAALHDLPGELRSHGFTSARTGPLLGAADDVDLLRNSALYALWSRDRVPDLTKTAAGVLTELFVRNGEVSLPSYERLIAGRLRGLLDTLDLVAVEDGEARARASLSPYASAYFLSDQIFTCRAASDGYPVMTRSTPGATDPVMPPHASTFRLLNQVAVGGGRLLDIGTGSGVVALSLADRYESVAGVDIDPRAVDYARINARLLGRREAVFEVADFRGELEKAGPADHAVFNAPGRAPATGDRGSGTPLSAERLVRDVAAHVPAALTAPGGLAEVLIVVPVPKRHAGAAETVAEWLGGRLHDGFRVREVTDPALSISAAAIENLRIQPGCLLADNRADAEALVTALRSAEIREVTPAILSINSQANWHSKSPYQWSS